MINKTATETNPWYVVPADHKWYARLVVSRIVLETLKEMNPQFPVVSDDEKENVLKYREELYHSLYPEENKSKCLDKNSDNYNKKHSKKKHHKKKEKTFIEEDTRDEDKNSIFTEPKDIVTDCYIEQEESKVKEKEMNDFASDYITQETEREKLVRSEKYIDWLYNFVKEKEVYDDESALYNMKDGEDKENFLLISYFQKYIEELATEQKVENKTDNKNEFEICNYNFNIKDKYYNISTMVGQGACTFVNLIDKPKDDTNIVIL